ncbi:MAG: hypothetical protein GXP32_05665 [Kiritimatiellaeota bacterium]|nr:hypothetical protein [Kiritimatiellota bacterium]
MPYSKTSSHTLLKLLLPYALILFLVALALGTILIPYAYHMTLERKKEALSELTSLAWHTLNYYHTLQENGNLTKNEAMTQAKAYIRTMRYGSDDKQYFWIIDTKGVPIVHPYRPDLEGTPLSAMRDQDGFFFIREFIQTAQRDGTGFVEYKWQWNDNPEIIKKKISCVKQFKPWGWIIGTGMYYDDATADISSFTVVIAGVLTVIVIFVSVLSYYLFKSVIHTEKEKRRAYEKLREQESKIRMLVEAIPDMLLRIRSDGMVLDYKEPLNFKPFIDPADILDKTINEAWPPLLARKILGALEKTFSDGKPHTIRFICEDFENPSDMKVEASFVVSGENEALASFRDITKRKKKLK